MKDVKVHERWYQAKVTTAGNDIALIKLPRAVVTVNEEAFGHVVLPICLDWDASGVRPAYNSRIHFIYSCNLSVIPHH